MQEGQPKHTGCSLLSKHIYTNMCRLILCRVQSAVTILLHVYDWPSLYATSVSFCCRKSFFGASFELLCHVKPTKSALRPGNTFDKLTGSANQEGEKGGSIGGAGWLCQQVYSCQSGGRGRVAGFIAWRWFSCTACQIKHPPLYAAHLQHGLLPPFTYNRLSLYKCILNTALTIHHQTINCNLLLIPILQSESWFMACWSLQTSHPRLIVILLLRFWLTHKL